MSTSISQPLRRWGPRGQKGVVAADTAMRVT